MNFMTLQFMTIHSHLDPFLILWNLYSMPPQIGIYVSYKYADVNNPPKAWTPATADDMKQFLFVNIIFGILQLPCYKDYWSTDELLGCPAVSSCMCRESSSNFLFVSFT